MLTPKQLKNHSFQSAGRNAYKSTEVDAYMEEIYQSYDQMFRENAELVKKIGMLADKVAEYKNDEDNIRNALLMAERMKDSIVAEAQDKAKEALSAAEEKVRLAKQAVNEKTASIIEKAEAEADKIVTDANERAEDTLKLAQANATKLLAKAQEIYDEQVNTVKDEAEKEREYLNKVKEESAKIRESLMDTYKMQIELLQFTPDFSEEVKEMHKKRIVETEEEEPEENTDVQPEEEHEKAELFNDSADELTEEEIESFEITESAADSIIPADESDDESEDIAIVAEAAPSIEKYLTPEDDEYEDIDSGNSLFDDEKVEEYAGEYGEDYDEEADYEKSVYTPNDVELADEYADEEEELTLFDRNED